METQVITVNINPERPNTMIRPPCHASEKKYGRGGIWNIKIHVSKCDPLQNKGSMWDKICSIKPADKHKIYKNKSYVAWQKRT